MRYSILFLLCLIFPFSISAQKKKGSNTPNTEKKSPYRIFFENGETEIKSDQNSIYSRTQDGIYLRRVVDQKTGTQSALLVYKDSTFDVQEGEGLYLWHNQQIRAIGTFKDNVKHGNWQYFTEEGKLESAGFYAMGKKGGRWKYYVYNSDALESSFFYHNGELNGPFQVFNESKEIINKGLFNNDTLIKVSNPDIAFFMPSADTIMPVFPGCDENLAAAELNACSDKKFLQFIFEHTDTPMDILLSGENVKGELELGFSISPTGKLFNLQVISSTDSRISEAALATIRQTPDWIPGSKQGRPIEIGLKRTVILEFYTAPSKGKKNKN